MIIKFNDYDNGIDCVPIDIMIITNFSVSGDSSS